MEISVSNIVKVIKKLLSGKARVQCQVKGVSSTMKAICCAVSQGSMLGPLIFIIYMNDLPAAVPDVSITMYADDNEIGKSFTSVTEINQCLIPASYKVHE